MKIQITLVALAFGIAFVNAQTIVVPSANTCTATSILTQFGFSAQTASVVNNGTCSNYFSVGGACVPVGQVTNAMNTQNRWLQTRSIDARNYALQFLNATLYWATQNGFVNANTNLSVNTNSISSFFSSLTNWLSNIANRATALFGQVSSWVSNIFNNLVNGVNPCFQAWANISNGAHCVLASSQRVNHVLGTSGSASPIAYLADPTAVGGALQRCIPLIDTYCSMTYGVSVSNSASPFNQTFNWADNGMSLATCYAFRNQTNVTNNSAALNLLLTNLFNTAWINFVPSAAQVTNLGSFLTTNLTVSPSTFVPISQTQNGVAINLIAIAGTTNTIENFVSDGNSSGQPTLVYGSAFKFAISLLAAFFALMI